MSNINQVTEQELQAKAVAPRISKEQIDELMKRVQFVTVQQPNDTTATFVHAFLDGNFFLATGFSGCVSKDNFNADIGVRLATENCKKQAENKLWELEGYALYAYLKKNKVPTDWKERVRLELEEVNTRRIALTNTLEKGNADNRICKVQWAFMQEQIEYMDGYSVVLSKRLAAALPPQ